MSNPYEDLIERLAAIEDDLRERAYERLSVAAARPDSDEAWDAEAEEQRLSAARRAVAKAINDLRRLGPPEEDWGVA
jgi:hypothetical protein